MPAAPKKLRRRMGAPVRGYGDVLCHSLVANGPPSAPLWLLPLPPTHTQPPPRDTTGSGRAPSRAVGTKSTPTSTQHPEVDVTDDQFNEVYPIGEVLWPMIRDSPVMRAKFRFQSQQARSQRGARVISNL